MHMTIRGGHRTTVATAVVVEPTRFEAVGNIRRAARLRASVCARTQREVAR